jgi:hypothetical protein
MFLYHRSRVLVPAESGKFRVTQVIAVCPFEIFDPRNNFGPDPDAFLHVIRGQAGSPAPLFLFSRFANGQSGIVRGCNRAKTCRRVSGTNPFRTLAT